MHAYTNVQAHASPGSKLRVYVHAYPSGRPIHMCKIMGSSSFSESGMTYSPHHNKRERHGTSITKFCKYDGIRSMPWVGLRCAARQHCLKPGTIASRYTASQCSQCVYFLLMLRIYMVASSRPSLQGLEEGQLRRVPACQLGRALTVTLKAHI